MSTPSGNSGYLSEMDIRIWLRDHDPAANLLIDDFEFGQEEIRTASTLAVDAWNEEPPSILGYELYDFPYRYALLRGTAANLLFIAANAYRRNKLQYSVPGGAINDQDKDKEYDAAGDRLWKAYMDWVRRKKRSINIERGWGTI
jgi:hypothetical protein